MALFFYNIFLIFYLIGIRIYALFNIKARKWKNGRKNLLHYISSTLEKNELPLVWVHCSSLGEFEQGRPVIDLLREMYKDHKIVLTFFSPSGYEVQKNYNNVDHVFYLPSDSPRNAEKFISALNPSLVIFVKYEYWYYYLKKIHEEKIPLLLISAVFNHSQPFFKWYGGLHKKMLKFFTHIFVQDQSSYDLLKNTGELPVTVAGDTRFDRVSEIKRNSQKIPFIQTFGDGKKLLVAGSTWPEDEEALLYVFQQSGFEDFKLIIAPHEINDVNLSSLRGKFKDAIFFSEIIDDQKIKNARYLVIDNIGMLSRLYQYSTVAYVGGGFSKSGIHNILEAAVWGKPVLFGPNHHKYIEAENLISAGGGKSFINKEELAKFLQQYFTDPVHYKKAAEAAEEFIEANKGATDKIISYIQENRLLTNL